ncbi:hypothetical protein IWX76_003208 [Pedobacter sp. CAN_A7]|uniref:hypothetical protein n=1 Tax=Pedobacter sp. CAN_A7 TaxID=2787722 RepID=UPI0018CA3A61
MIILKEMVLDTLDPQMVQNFSVEELEEWRTGVAQAVNKLINAMREEVYGSVDDHLVKRHIQQVQNDCTFLLQSLQTQPHMDGLLFELQTVLREGMEKVLRYIEKHHGRYFSLKVPMPISFFKISVDELAPQLDLLKMGMKKKQVTSILQELILKCFYDYLKAGEAPYERMHYMNNLYEALMQLCKNAPVDDFNQLLVECLIFLLFNDPTFESYVKARLIEKFNTLYNVTEKLQALYQVEKSIKMMQERTSACYDPQRPNLKLVLLAFIKAEIKFLTKKQNAALILSIEGQTKMNRMIQPPEYRIKMTFSADALAYFLRLLIEANIIVAVPRSELLVFMARHVQTPGIGQAFLSPNSLGTKYKQVVQTTAKNVYAALMRMLKILNKDFNLNM